MKNNKYYCIVMIIFVLALLVRILYALTLDNINVGLWDDEGWEIAKNMVEGKGYEMSYHVGGLRSFRPPVFPLFLAGIFAVFGQNMLVVRVFLALFGSLICLVIFFLAKKMLNRDAGLIAMAVSAFYPAFIYWSGYIGPETLAILFFSLASLFLLKIEDNLLLYSILTGVHLALFSMCRSLGYGLIFISCIWLVGVFKKKMAALSACGIILIIAFLAVSPWVMRNYRVHHRFVLASTEGGITFYSANNPQVFIKGRGDFYVPESCASEVAGLSEVDADRHFYRRGLDFVKSDPLLYLKLVFHRATRFWRFYPHITGAEDSYNLSHIIIMLLTDGPIILLGFLGLALLWKRKRNQVLLIILFCAYFTAVSMAVKSCIRYRAIIMPHLIVLASYVICRLRAKKPVASFRGRINTYGEN